MLFFSDYKSNRRKDPIRRSYKSSGQFDRSSQKADQLSKILMSQLFSDWWSKDEDLEYFDYEVLLSNNTLFQFEDLMSRYKEWETFKRDIRLANISESDRIQFDIQSISMIVSLGNHEKIKSLQYSAISCKGMSFILKGDKIDSLMLRCRVLETPMGKIVKELMEYSMQIDLKPNILDGKVKYFYVDTNENSAA